MITIKRPPAPTFLTDVKNNWHLETIQAILHYRNKNSVPAFTYKMYNDKALKDALRDVFGLKCAYCESKYAQSADGDVEHFRPKGKVNEKTPQTPGYYWLANDWDNLLLACQHCNQNRRHQLYGEAKMRAVGKLDQFPIKDENQRIHSHSKKKKIANEQRLLLNPCLDDPTEHFAYESTEGVIVPLTDEGKKSVEVYALQRPLLVQARKQKMTELFSQIEIVKACLEVFNKNRNITTKNILAMVLDQLLNFAEAEQEYAGMSRYFIKKFLNDNNLD